MSETLTRERVEGYLMGLVQDKVDGMRVARLLDTDAALRSDIESRDRTIAAMSTKAMSLVPGCQNVDAAWGTLAALQADVEAARVHLVGRDALITQLRAEVEALKQQLTALEEALKACVSDLHKWVNGYPQVADYDGDGASTVEVMRQAANALAAPGEKETP